MKYASFNRFELAMPDLSIEDCSHSGPCDDDVAFWAPKIIALNPEVTAKLIRLELREYGAWSDQELSDNDANWQRLVWIAAGNIAEEENV